MKYLSLLLMIGCASCKTSIRAIDICLIEQVTAHCALKDKNYELAYPDQMIGYSAFDSIALDLLGSRLEECDVNGKLPKDDDTLNEMKICEIGATDCTDIDGWYAVPPSAMAKIQSRFEFCTR